MPTFHKISLRERLDATTEKLRSPVPRTLYHYTSAAGFNGIIQFAELWASNARYLNDSAEIRLGIRHVKSILKSHRRKQLVPERSALLEYLWKYVRLLESVEDRIYAVCFCEQDDLLGQWRGYANMGGGYSLGFDPQRFNFDLEEDLQPRLVRVIYDTGAQRKVIRDVLEEAYDWLASLSLRRRAKEIEPAADEVIITLFGLVAAFKDDSFKAEREWRLVYTPSIEWLAKNLRFLDYGAWLKPYIISRPWPAKQPAPIVSVTCGPSLNAQLSVAAVRLELQRHSYLPMRIRPGDRLPVDVRASKVPFRYSR